MGTTIPDAATDLTQAREAVLATTGRDGHLQKVKNPTAHPRSRCS